MPGEVALNVSGGEESAREAYASPEPPEQSEEEAVSPAAEGKEEEI